MSLMTVDNPHHLANWYGAAERYGHWLKLVLADGSVLEWHVGDPKPKDVLKASIHGSEPIQPEPSKPKRTRSKKPPLNESSTA
jgi:hypothetical protein